MRKPKKYMPAGHQGIQPHETGPRGRAGIFGVNHPVGTTLKAAGGSPGFDPFTKSIAHGRAMSTKHAEIPKTVYVGNSPGKQGVGSY